MSSLAQQMADEWWFKVRERFYRSKGRPVNAMTYVMIEEELIESGMISKAGDVAGTACKLLEEKVLLEMKGVMAQGIETWLAHGMGCDPMAWAMLGAQGFADVTIRRAMCST